MVRTLAGDAAFHLPYGGINRSHYDVALETLRHLDWVVPLESCATPNRTRQHRLRRCSDFPVLDVLCGAGRVSRSC